MKRILIALLVITTLSATAQESVLLRLNYTKGDSFLVTTESNQSRGTQGGLNMKMTMGMIVTEVSEDNIKTESQITAVVMDMMQGGMTMSYDSNKKEEELDQVEILEKNHPGRVAALELVENASNCAGLTFKELLKLVIK